MDKINKPIFKIIIFVVVVIIMSFVAKSLLGNNSEYTVDVNSRSSAAQPKASKIRVDIKGEVKNPGVYMVDSVCIVDDVVKLAGGYTEAADVEKINRAMKVYDGQEIVIPGIDSDNEYKVFDDVLGLELDD